MSDILNSEIKYLAGVGPKRASLLNEELGIFSFEDLLYYFPYKYVDRTKFYSIKEVTPFLPYVQIRGKFIRFSHPGGPHSRRLMGLFTDGDGIIEVLWFKGANWILQSIKPDKEYIIFAKPSEYGGKINIVHPEIDEASKWEASLNMSLQAYYNTTEKLKDGFLGSKAIQKLQNALIKQILPELKESLPQSLIQRLKLLPLPEALQHIHFPGTPDQLKKAQYRLKFEELFYIQLNILCLKEFRNQRNDGFVFSKVGDSFNTFFFNHLPFELTNAQKRVLKEIRKDLNSGRQMNRLLQGDVGSGKTLVALMTMLIALDNGFQACIMAPTEILAHQHFDTLKKFLEGMNVQVKLLTGSTKKSERDKIHSGLLDGSLHLLIGTHALIEDVVQFKNLGLVIIDEQHRFGVAQRAKLWKKNVRRPHVLVMTATPIPRTLAMTLYGDLDISVIDELPPGRKPIRTIHMYDSSRLRMHGFLREQIKSGRQAYVVYPLITESEKMDYKALEEGYDSLTQAFPAPEYAVSVVQGKLKNDVKEKAMRLFVDGKTHIMIATTVIEVGVDVPNAAIMVIENAERFGLSQLHQLRGRVGRGAEQSFCILMTPDKLSQDAKKRINTLVGTNDGFEIAEVDLKLRGPGDMEGTLQSGVPFELKIADLGKDGRILQYARDIAREILISDPTLTKPENILLRHQLKKQNKNKVYWGEIS
jgi:ATP-dependent DNA helicase RecG